MPQVIVSDFDETLPKGRFQHAYEYAVETARQKAIDVAVKTRGDARLPDLVIGADTIVEACGEILEKPADAEDAFRVLSMWVPMLGCVCVCGGVSVCGACAAASALRAGAGRAAS